MRDELIARYLVTTPLDIDQVAELIAGEQSSGTFAPVPGETPELKRRSRARVSSIEPASLIAGELKSSFIERRLAKQVCSRTYVVETAVPTENFGSNLQAMCTSLLGNIFELGELTGLRLVGIELSQDHVRQFDGPRFGVKGTRRIAGVHGRPLIGTIVKPSIGLPADQIASIVDTLCRAGIDFIKDDELLCNPAVSPLHERIERVMPVIQRNCDQHGQKVMYAFNITDSMDEMLRSAERIENAGGTCAMVNIHWAGLSAIQKLRKETPLAIHGHRAGWGIFSRHPNLGVEFSVMQLIYRLAGIDHLHVNGLDSKFWEPNESVVASARACLDETSGLVAAMPVFSAGQTIAQIPKTYGELGSADLMYLAGGGIFAHPKGTEQGVADLRQAWQDALAYGAAHATSKS